MNCKKCGSPLDNNATFCGICGTPVEPQMNNQMENQQSNMNQPTPDIFQTVGPVQPEVQPIPTVEPVQPEVQPVPTVEPVQPEVQPVPTVEPTQPEVQPIPTVEPTQPEVQPIPTIEPVQPEVQPVPTVEPVQPQVMPQLETPAFKPLKEETKEKKNSKLPIILILLILLGVGGFFVYKFFFNKPDKVVKGLINNAYDKFESSFKKYNAENDTVLVNADLSISTNIEGLEDLNGMKINLTSGIDQKNNKYEFGLSYSENNNKVLEGLMYLLDKNAYLVLKDIYANPIKINTEDINLDEITSETKKASTEDVEFLIKRFKDIFLESLNMNDFKQSSATITLDGKETKVKKVSYTLDSVKARKLINNIIDNMSNDKEFMEKLSNLTNMDVEMLKQQLNNSKVDSTIESEGSIKFDIYTKGVTDEFVGMDISLANSSDIKIRKSNNTTTIEATLSGVIIKITTKEESKGNTTTDININVLGQEITGKLTTEEKEIDSKTTETKMTFNMNFDGQQIGYTLNMKEQIGANIADIDVTNAKTAEELTETELNLIQQKIMEKLEGSKLYNFINTQIGNALGAIEEKNSFDYDFDSFDYDFDSFDYSEFEGL